MQERLGDAVDKAMGNLLYHMATRFKGSEERTSLLLDYVCGKKICTELQITGSDKAYLLQILQLQLRKVEL